MSVAVVVGVAEIHFFRLTGAKLVTILGPALHLVAVEQLLTDVEEFIAALTLTIIAVMQPTTVLDLVIQTLVVTGVLELNR
jgi:hypothetical protein